MPKVVVYTKLLMPNSSGTTGLKRNLNSAILAKRFILFIFVCLAFLALVLLFGVLRDYFADGYKYLYRSFFFISDFFSARYRPSLMYFPIDVTVALFLAFTFTFLDFPRLRRAGVLVVSLVQAASYFMIGGPADVTVGGILIFATGTFLIVALVLFLVTEICAKFATRIAQAPVVIQWCVGLALLIVPYIALSYFILPKDVTRCDSVHFSERKDACYINILQRTKSEDGYKLCANVSQLKRKEQCEEIFLDYVSTDPLGPGITDKLCQTIGQLLDPNGCRARL